MWKRRRGSQEERHKQVEHRSHLFFIQSIVPLSLDLEHTTAYKCPQFSFNFNFRRFNRPPLPLGRRCQANEWSSLPSVPPRSHPTIQTYGTYPVSLPWLCTTTLTRQAALVVFSWAAAATSRCPLRLPFESPLYSPLLAVLPPLTRLSMEIM